jgi:hypothetical protein
MKLGNDHMTKIIIRQPVKIIYEYFRAHYDDKIYARRLRTGAGFTEGYTWMVETLGLDGVE